MSYSTEIHSSGNLTDDIEGLKTFTVSLRAETAKHDETVLLFDAMKRAFEKLDDGPPGKGTRYRYHLDLPGGLKETLEVEQTVYLKPKRCAGKFVRGPLKGTWSYTYTESKAGGTHVIYEMEYELGGLLRFAGGLLAGQYAAGIRKNMEALKKYVESGKGPKPKE